MHLTPVGLLPFENCSRLISVAAKSFHEKAGECQVFSLISPIFFLLLCFFFFQIVPIEPSRLCRHPSIRTLC
jgi:hypothetical protein